MFCKPARRPWLKLRSVLPHSRPKNSIRIDSIRNLLSSSYVEGSKESQLSTETLTSFFEKELLPNYSSKAALICRKESPRAHGGPQHFNLGRADCLAWNFEDFSRHIDALAYGLRSLGVKVGDRIGVVMGNNSAYASLQWASAKIGAILVTINPAYRTRELISTLKLVGVSTLVVVPSIRTSKYLHSLSEAIPGLASSTPGDIHVEELPELRNILVVDNTPGSDEIRRLFGEIKCSVNFRESFLWNPNSIELKSVKEIQASASNEDIVNLQFTSGTTGAPKAVSLTHKNLLNNGLSIGKCMKLTSEDILCNVPPLFHCFDEYSITHARNLAAWSHGACIVYASEIYNPPSIVDAVVEEKCTALHGVPTHFLGVLAEVESRRLSGELVNTERLRTGIAAGSPVPIELMQRLIRELNLVGLTNAYGMTETSPVSFQTTVDDPIEKRTETVGRVQPHVRAKIIDSDGNIVPVGTPGEICVSGYLTQKGYWEDEGQTKQVMKHHPGDPETVWMHTGDIGVLDQEGYLKVVGRSKDVIIRGGENLFPVQIENQLTFHPAIREAAVVAVPDQRYGEVVGAWIVREKGTRQSREEVRKWVADGMNPQNAPTWVWFVGEDVPEELPKTASGKVQKHILRDWGRELAARRKGHANMT